MNQLFKLKAFAVSALMLSCGFGAFAQDRNNDDEVVKLDARSSRFNYRDGEIIVKFKPSSLVNVRSLKNGQFSTTGIKTLDAKLNAMGLFEAEPLMPLSGANVNTLTVKSLNGQKVVDNDMSKLYRLKFDTAKLKSVDEAIAEIKSMAEVEYAEPNYLVYTLATDADVYSLDPLYGEQWGFDAINLPALWAMPKISDKRPVIAILDTGIEFTHMDLLNNIWTNEAEFTGATGTDDDGNGYKDDMYGWDFVNQNNRMDDYNGHGTHCAGIAAAVGGNGKGGVGANPDALIMPIAVLQSDGAGDIATLVKGIDYATANGADILSLSLVPTHHLSLLNKHLPKPIKMQLSLRLPVMIIFVLIHICVIIRKLVHQCSRPPIPLCLECKQPINQVHSLHSPTMTATVRCSLTLAFSARSNYTTMN